MKGGSLFWLIQGGLVHLHNVVVWVTLQCSWLSGVKAQNTCNCFMCRNAFRWLLWNLFSSHIPLWWDFQFLHCIFDVLQEIPLPPNYKIILTALCCIYLWVLPTFNGFFTSYLFISLFRRSIIYLSCGWICWGLFNHLWRLVFAFSFCFLDLIVKHLLLPLIWALVLLWLCANLPPGGWVLDGALSSNWIWILSLY